MSMSLMLAAGAVVLALAALLVLQRRRAAAADDTEEAPADERRADTAADEGAWRAPGAVDRIRAILRGGRTGLGLLRSSGHMIRLHREENAVRIVASHDSVYGGRPNWEHITALTLVMAQAERCWPGADLSGLLQYTDTAVPVEYSPRLVADLEDEAAPSPEHARAA